MKTYRRRKLTGLILMLIVYAVTPSCDGDAYTPKPRGFQRIVLPAHAYTEFNPPCPFRFEIPVYSQAAVDVHPSAGECWYNLNFPAFDATLHLSYKPLHSRSDLLKITEDSRTLVYKHTIRADEIYETIISNHYLSGMLYELSGNTATSFQFYVTDSTRNYLRGALYFNVHTNNDSVAPVLDFMKADIYHLIESLRWN